jgi:hypothetical protein
MVKCRGPKWRNLAVKMRHHSPRTMSDGTTIAPRRMRFPQFSGPPAALPVPDPVEEDEPRGHQPALRMPPREWKRSSSTSRSKPSSAVRVAGSLGPRRKRRARAFEPRSRRAPRGTLRGAGEVPRAEADAASPAPERGRPPEGPERRLREARGTVEEPPHERHASGESRHVQVGHGAREDRAERSRHRGVGGQHRVEVADSPRGSSGKRRPRPGSRAKSRAGIVSSTHRRASAHRPSARRSSMVAKRPKVPPSPPPSSSFARSPAASPDRVRAKTATLRGRSRQPSQG